MEPSLFLPWNGLQCVAVGASDEQVAGVDLQAGGVGGGEGGDGIAVAGPRAERARR